jgi:hypothetical protein
MREDTQKLFECYLGCVNEKNIIDEKPIKKEKQIASYRLIGDYGVVMTLKNGDEYYYNHRDPNIWNYTKKPESNKILTIQLDQSKVPTFLKDIVNDAFSKNDVEKDNPDISRNKMKGKFKTPRY